MGPGGREMLEYCPWWGCEMMQHWNGGTHLWLCWRSEYAGVTEKCRLRAPSMSCMFFSDVWRYGEAFVFEGALLRSWYQAGSVQVKFKLEWTTGVEPSFGLADRACCTKSRDVAIAQLESRSRDARSHFEENLVSCHEFTPKVYRVLYHAGFTLRWKILFQLINLGLFIL